MSCCYSRDVKWKREKIQDHKFDYIDVDDFVSKSCLSYLKYFMVYMMTLKSILSYMLELVVVVLLIFILTNNKIDGLPDPSSGAETFEGSGKTNSTSSTKSVNEVFGGDWFKSEVRIGLIIASVFVSYILLSLEWRKAFTIIQSRDISYAFTSTVAYRYYAIRSYPHFCVFDKISRSRKTKDTLSLWVYFRMKGWKKLIFAESPRQILNAINVDAIIRSFTRSYPSILAGKNILEKFFLIFTQIRDKVSFDVFAVFVITSLLVLIWIFAIVSLAIATILYLFLLQSIRGNLKEYCVHKIDKRIDGLLKKKSRKRILDARKAELEELERSVYDGDSRAAPPLGMTVGPRYPNLAVDYNDHLYSEYSGSLYARSDHGGMNGAGLNPAPRSEYGDDYRSDYGGPARSDYGGPARSDYGGPARSDYGYAKPVRSNYGAGSEYSYGGLNPVYAGSVAVGTAANSDRAPSEQVKAPDNYHGDYASSYFGYYSRYDDASLPPIPDEYKQ